MKPNFLSLMKARSVSPVPTIALLSILLLFSVHSSAQNAVTDWNAVAIAQARASSAPGASAAGGTNVYVAYVELAVYNALVAIQGGYQPYEYSVTAPPGSSADAAAVEAAYRTLLYLLPDRAVPLTTAYDADLPPFSAR
jgi:hypothetical protein